MTDVAKHYDRLIEENQDPVHDPIPLKEYMNKWDGQLFLDKLNLDNTKSVLEIGVGTGRIAVKVVPLCGNFIGIDISEKTVDRARKNLNGLSNWRIVHGDFIRFEFNETFDVIYSSLTFLHIQEKQRAFHTVFNLLEEGGIFVLSIDKNQNSVLDTGFSKIAIFPDNPANIQHYATISGLKIVDQSETDFAHIFTFTK